MRSAKPLLSINGVSEGNIEDLQYVMLQSKLYVNIGKPRKYWLKAHYAMTISILLRLPKASTPEYSTALWSQIWQLDRELLSLLGLPNGITEFHPGLSKVFAGDHFLSRAMHDISIIAAHITERIQSSHDLDYSVTLQIDQELEQCRAAIPLDWWDMILTPNMPLHEH